MMDPEIAARELAISAHDVLTHGYRGEVIDVLGRTLADWLAASELRMCDSCGRITDAGDSPDWPNGECEACDPQTTYR